MTDRIELLPNPGTPQRIGRFRILRKIGEGGMGVVYAARDERLERTVALKVMRDMLGETRRAAERFWQEARAAAKVNHPHICQLYEFGEEDGRLFFTMELLDGESLGTRIARGPLPLAEAVQCGLSMLSALEALHQRDLVHRDLKPSNVFLTPHGLKLLDFGLARPASGALAQTQTGLTLTGTIVGTPDYMAPEQVLGHAVDARTDLFTVGIILFEMLAGRRPFSGDSAMKVLQAVLYEQPPALMGSPAIAAVDRVIRKALTKEPAERYVSAAAMAQDLRAALLLEDFGEAPRARVLTRLAVVPFHLLRPDAEIDFLAFSVADAVTASLCGLESLVVRSSRVSARFGGDALNLKTIAAELDVDVVLTGTLLRAGDQVRVSTELVQVADAKILWSQTALVALGDLFQLHDSLVTRIVGALPLTARDEQRARPDVPATANAYELYLRANQLSYESSTWALARDLYLRCVEEDANYAPAWAQLGRLHWIIGKFAAEDTKESMRRAEAAFRHALELNPKLSTAHNLYANLEVDAGRAEKALERLLEQARERPADPELFAGLVYALRFCGLLKASVAAHNEARRFDPAVRTSVYHTYVMLGDYERVVEERHRTEDPTPALIALWILGRREEALAALNVEEKRAGSHRILLHLRQGLRGLLEDRREAAVSAFEVVASGGDAEGWFYVAKMLTSLGEIERAVALLEQVVAVGGFFCFPALARDPMLDPLRGRAEFAAVLRQAETRHRAAARMFVDLDGERLLAYVSESN